MWENWHKILRGAPCLDTLFWNKCDFNSWVCHPGEELLWKSCCWIVYFINCIGQCPSVEEAVSAATFLITHRSCSTEALPVNAPKLLRGSFWEVFVFKQVVVLWKYYVASVLQSLFILSSFELQLMYVYVSTLS